MCVCARARVRVCNLGYSACNAHAPYCHLWSVRPYHIFPHGIKHATLFGKELFFSTNLSETFLILRRIQQDIINVQTSPCKAAVILVRLQWNLIFSTDFRKNTQTSNFMIIRPVAIELFHTYGRARRRTDRLTDTMKLIVAFRNFANAPKNAQFT